MRRLQSLNLIQWLIIVEMIKPINRKDGFLEEKFSFEISKLYAANILRPKKKWKK